MILGKYKRSIVILVGLLVAGMIGAGSMAVAIQPVSDEKIHIQDTPGKIQTNVPVGGSRSFTPLPVIWSADKDVKADGDGVFTGSTVESSQKIAINFVTQVSTETSVKLYLDNLSDDDAIFLIKAGTKTNVILDMESADVDVVGLTGHNEWLAHIDADSTDQQLTMEVQTIDPGFYPIVVELERVG